MARFTKLAICIGMEPKLISKEILKNGDFKQLIAKMANALAIINQVRK